MKTQVFGSQSVIKEVQEPILEGGLERKEQLSRCEEMSILRVSWLKTDNPNDAG